MQSCRTGAVIGLAAAAALLALWATRATAAPPESAQACSAPRKIARFDTALPRTARLLSEGRPLKIVAFGSSSTAGTGASSPANAYPARLEGELRLRLPNVEVVVLNRGIAGEDAKQMLARIDASVIAEKPDLVLWQVGTNAVLDDYRLANEEMLVRAGLDRLKATGADIILIDPQYAPKVIVKPEATRMVRLLDAIGRQGRVGVFHRFAVMHHWYTALHMRFADFIAPDGLHLNDWSYLCTAKLLAGAIMDAAGPSAPVANVQRTARRPRA
jgi:acyl-CoA thioesterase I